jgi:hypothetical protein
LTSVALRLGPLEADEFVVVRSGLRWLREDGHLCRRGEVVAFCNVGLLQREGRRNGNLPFPDERQDLQMAFATPIGGRLRHGLGVTGGGFQNFQLVNFWTPDDVIGHIELQTGQWTGEADDKVRLLMMAGRRVTGLAEGRSGLLTGWHDRSRACRVEGDGPIGTLLSLGICEMYGVIKGESFAFLELLDAIEGPAQVIFVPDVQLVPNTRVVAEQIRRTLDEHAAITQDLAASLAGGGVSPDAADWVFAGAVLKALGTSPATERYNVLTRNGLRKAGPPDAIVLSLHAEEAVLLRHRRLGYALCLHRYRLNDTGRAFLPWLRANFELVRRTVQDIHADYRALIDLIRASAPATQILICNIMSTLGEDDVQSYDAFNAPIGETLKSVRFKDLNLMLCDLARERDIAIIDADAIAAELGGRRNLIDGVHGNGAMQAEMRAEILHILRARRVPGFVAPQVR